jgi:hypothetical protein
MLWIACKFTSSLGMAPIGANLSAIRWAGESSGPHDMNRVRLLFTQDRALSFRRRRNPRSSCTTQKGILHYVQNDRAISRASTPIESYVSAYGYGPRAIPLWRPLQTGNFVLEPFMRILATERVAGIYDQTEAGLRGVGEG